MLEISGKHQNISDEELLEKFRTSGNLDLLGALYARYMHLVYGVGLKYFKDRDEAQDVVMNVFEQLIVNLPKQKVQNFKSWLYVITKNHCLMELRSKKSKDRKLEGLQIEQEFMESSEEMHPIDKEDDSVDKVLKDCIEKLKIEQKQCIELFYYKKLCYQEVADTLNLDEKKVKSYLQNGKRNLKICLEGKNVR